VGRLSAVRRILLVALGLLALVGCGSDGPNAEASGATSGDAALITELPDLTMSARPTVLWFWAPG
jgi:hypothetical protein